MPYKPPVKKTDMLSISTEGNKFFCVVHEEIDLIHFYQHKRTVPSPWTALNCCVPFVKIAELPTLKPMTTSTTAQFPRTTLASTTPTIATTTMPEKRTFEPLPTGMFDRMHLLLSVSNLFQLTRRYF